ncbi:hypothetical protein CR152_32055 [Massilia violaceinigra]|uniref:Uncharacterized protein n=1 Tax=Massilia violaceinigra TaxID=2045208 RepID=A0A2D2DIP7_9BURK|nr:hypothetical protein [Massilia violaceinigra]ATQ74841.1 hypothetical protein CR152_10125 [Massilia violaceinigra]ATQ78639.1 hypothetical protein CR152_32055 [Massilia violaceinigra]
MTKNDRPVPAKIEQRLMELLKMKEFDMQEVTWCRATYWARRGDWHAILVACHDTALARIATEAAAACATEVRP